MQAPAVTERAPMSTCATPRRPATGAGVALVVAGQAARQTVGADLPGFPSSLRVPDSPPRLCATCVRDHPAVEAGHPSAHRTRGASDRWRSQAWVANSAFRTGGEDQPQEHRATRGSLMTACESTIRSCRRASGSWLSALLASAVETCASQSRTTWPASTGPPVHPQEHRARNMGPALVRTSSDLIAVWVRRWVIGTSSRSRSGLCVRLGRVRHPVRWPAHADEWDCVQIVAR